LSFQTSRKNSVNGKQVSPAKMPDDVNYIESASAQFNMRVSELIDAAARLQDDFNREFRARNGTAI